jgi:hypothetical protein
MRRELKVRNIPTFKTDNCFSKIILDNSVSPFECKESSRSFDRELRSSGKVSMRLKLRSREVRVTKCEIFFT